MECPRGVCERTVSIGEDMMEEVVLNVDSSEGLASVAPNGKSTSLGTLGVG